MTTATDRPHCVYRFFDADGVLLYVGMTVNLPKRIEQHGRDKPWWTAVTRIDVERHPDGVTARNAEQAAMDRESPKYNLCRSVGRTPLRSFRIPDDLWNEALAFAAENGETISDVARRGLQEYVDGVWQPDPDGGKLP